ncbi:hypothetical protein ECEC1870_2105, partial [Escherichia coli EC1870]
MISATGAYRKCEDIQN